jgi:hypothetical protein
MGSAALNHAGSGWSTSAVERAAWHDAAMRLSLLLAIVCLAASLIAGLIAPAAAHVAPAVGDNNRYLKLTPLGDRIRLAYTVFYGEVPAMAIRQTIDRNHDGEIDDAESQAFGEGVAREIAAALDVVIDGARQPVAWSQVVVGLGTPRVAAGAFSVDLVAWLCLPSPRGKHAVVLRDDFHLARPGETEVKVEDSPGVTIHGSRIGGAEDEAHDYNLVGPSGALHTEGLELEFTAGDKAMVTADATCRRDARTGSAGLAGALVAGAALVGVLALALLALIRRRSRGR